MNKIDVVKSYWKSEGEKGLSGILSHFHENALFSSPTMQLKGINEIKTFYEGMINNFKKIEVIPTHWIEQENEITDE